MRNRSKSNNDISEKSDAVHIFVTALTMFSITLLSVSLFTDNSSDLEAVEQERQYIEANTTEDDNDERQYYFNSEDKLFNEAYGPNGMKNLDMGMQGAELSQAAFYELKKRIDKDPVLAAICVSYYLKRKGEYTEYYFPTLSNKDSIEITIDRFVCDQHVWKNAVAMFGDTLDSAVISILPMKEGSFYTYLLKGGNEHPSVLEYCESEFENSSSLHVLSVLTHSKKGDDITLLFFVEGGFMPISYKQ